MSFDWEAAEFESEKPLKPEVIVVYMLEFQMVFAIHQWPNPPGPIYKQEKLAQESANPRLVHFVITTWEVSHT